MKPSSAICRASLTCRTLVILALALSAIPVSAGQAADAQRVRWKPVSEAQVRLDDKTPLTWNIFQPDKKDKKSAKKSGDLVLLLLGHRYLLLDLKGRLVYEVPVAALQARGTDFDSGDLTQGNPQIPSKEWMDRDVGPAELIRLTLGDYDRVLEISLPHPPDMRPFY
ncbi:MAG TPA: hypothetical protein VMM16_01400 [Verrucomicrobiae bacterium]|nr:hypothetical protein [Verrucomicrobiae bacterium]